MGAAGGKIMGAILGEIHTAIGSGRSRDTGSSLTARMGSRVEMGMMRTL